MHRPLRLLVLLWFVAFAYSAAARSENLIRISSLTINPVMPGDPKVWRGNSIILTAETLEPAQATNSVLVVRIKQGGKVICGNSSALGLLVLPFTNRSFIMEDMVIPFSQCPALAPGAYDICFQFFNEKNEALSEEACKDFTVKDPAGTIVTYTAPQNILPADGQRYAENAIKGAVSFKWTSVKPAPEGDVTYRLRIWQLRKEQNAAAAMESAAPVFTRDIVNATEVTLTNAFPLPCQNPEDCRFVWNVQALNSAGQPIGTNYGYSQATAIVIATTYIIRIDSIRVSCTATPGVYSFSYTIANVNPTTAKLSNFIVTSSTPAGALIASFSPPLNTNIASGNQLTITGTINASPSLSNICIGAQITDVANTFNQASKDTCIAVSPCRCDACDPKKTNININPTNNIVVNNNNTLSLSQPISIATMPLKLVKSVRAELVYFEFVPENESCLPCNKDSKTFGNLDNGTLAATPGTGGGTHSLLWNFFPFKNFSSTNVATMTVTLPPTVSCCAATIKWCIRYVFTFSDCTVCNKLVCYEKQKTGCANGNGNGNPNNN